MQEENNYMNLIYVAGKYTSDNYTDIENNIKKAEYASIELIRRGWAVITPHKNMSHYEMYESTGILSYEDWIAIDLEILKRCDAIFMLEDWEDSIGAREEHQFSENNNIKIYYQNYGYPESKYFKRS